MWSISINLLVMAGTDKSNRINCYYFFELQEAMGSGTTPAKEKNLRF
jgi:hypothetical protein